MRQVPGASPRHRAACTRRIIDDSIACWGCARCECSGLYSMAWACLTMPQRPRLCIINIRGERPREITRKGTVYRRCSSCPASRRPTGHLMVVHGIHQSYRYFDSVILLCGGHALPLPCSDLGMATIKPLWDQASAFTMQRAGAHAGRLSFVSNFDWCARRGWRPGSHLPAHQSPCLPQSTPEVSSSSRHGQQLLLLLQPEQSSILSVCC